MNELHLFAGAGGGILGGMLLGHACVCAVEIEPYPRSVLLQRQRDGVLPKFPIWDDVTTFDGNPWRGRVDIVCGGFPCQDISAAGKGAGITGEKSGLWGEMRRIICEIRPAFAFVENSPMLTIRGLGTVLGDLAEMGYDATWGVFGSDNVGIPVRRDRMFILASSNMRRVGQRRSPKSIIKLNSSRDYYARNSRADDETTFQDMRNGTEFRVLVEGWRKTQPELLRTSDGVASYMDRHIAIGNGQVPAVAALAWSILSERG